MIFMMPKWLVVKNQTKNKNNKKDLRENRLLFVINREKID